jgi:hypothetical protein
LSGDTLGAAIIFNEKRTASALTVKPFPRTNPYRLPGLPLRFVPCPNEVQKKALYIKRIATGMSNEEYEPARREVTTCMDCGLCLDADKRFAKRDVIVFEEHGPAQAKQRNRQLREAEELVQISVRKEGP